jgi:hypothetical protein
VTFQRILGILLLLAATALFFWIATRVHGALQGPNFSDVGVPMHRNQALARLAGLACLLGCIGLATWALRATLLQGIPGLAWGIGVGLGLVAAVLFWIGSSWG